MGPLALIRLKAEQEKHLPKIEDNQLTIGQQFPLQARNYEIHCLIVTNRLGQFALSLSLFLSIYVSLWLQDKCHMMPFVTSSTVHVHLSHVSSSQSILLFTTYPSIAQIKFTNHSPTIFLRLPYSELLEKRVFRSRANRRLVFVVSSPRKPRFVLVPIRFASEAWPRSRSDCAVHYSHAPCLGS